MKWRKSALFKFEILGLIVDRLTADDKYSRRKIQNLTQELQTAISHKQKTFSGIFITYLKSITNSEAFAIDLRYVIKIPEKVFCWWDIAV